MPGFSATPPEGWTDTHVDAPPLGDAAGATYTRWRATASPNGREALVDACVASPIPGWVEDMRPAVEARATALVAAAAERVAGVPVEARLDGGAAGAGADDSALVLFHAGGPAGGPSLGVARRGIGFDVEGRLDVCFAVCASSGPRPRDANVAPSSLACEASVRAARFEPGAAPPAAGLSLRGVTWAVHHPRDAAAAGALVAAVFAVLAVSLRRKPRARI